MAPAKAKASMPAIAEHSVGRIGDSDEGESDMMKANQEPAKFVADACGICSETAGFLRLNK